MIYRTKDCGVFCNTHAGMECRRWHMSPGNADNAPCCRSPSPWYDPDI